MGSKVRKEYGRFVSFFASYVDSPEFDRLSLNAASILTHAIKIPGGLTGVLMAFNEQIAARSKVPLVEVPAALEELEGGLWIVREGRWIWLRNHLKMDPGFHPNNVNHWKWILREMEGLPRIGLVRAFIAYYQPIGFLPPAKELVAALPWTARLPPPPPSWRRVLEAVQASRRRPGDDDETSDDESLDDPGDLASPGDLGAGGGGDLGAGGNPPGGVPEGSDRGPGGVGGPLPDPSSVSVSVSGSVSGSLSSTRSSLEEGRKGVQGEPQNGRRPVARPPSGGVQDAAVRRVFEAYLRLMKLDPAKYTLTTTRRKTIEAILRTSKVSECIQAIEGCVLSDFHMGREGKGLHNELTRILKSRDDLERFLQIRDREFDRGLIAMYLQQGYQTTGEAIATVDPARFSLLDLNDPFDPFYWRNRLSRRQ